MTLLTNGLLSAETVDEAQAKFSVEGLNYAINQQKFPWIKQMLICEREWTYYAKTGDPKKCLKAAEMVLALKGKTAPFSSYELQYLNGKDDSSISKQAAQYVNSAGLIYGEQGDYKNQIKMYEKASNLGNAAASMNLGKLYYFGENVQKNHFKAFEYFKKSLNQGYSDAQVGIEAVCKESPWACK